jgi:hypothetical protein
MINHVVKLWGSEDWLVNDDFYCAKYLNLNRGFECSLHFHVLKSETFYTLGGVIKLHYIDLMENLSDNLKDLIISNPNTEIHVPEENLKEISIIWSH